MSETDEVVVTFKDKYSLDERKEQAEKALNKYPGRVPVIAEPLTTKQKWTDKLLDPLEKQKYLVPADFTVAQLMYSIRKRISLSQEDALFFYVEGVLVPMSSTLDVVYEQYKDEDGFVYFQYCSEGVFG